MEAKEAVGRAAVRYVEDGMTIGIGTGSTAAFFIQALGERIQREALRVSAVPTSTRSRELAQTLNIPLVDLSDVGELDVTIDGADEVDSALHLIKGGGGALVREKIVASASRQLIIICDESKCKPVLGGHPLPVAVLSFGYEATHRRLKRFCEEVVLRPGVEGSDRPYVTDDGLYLFDMHFHSIPDPSGLEQALKRIVGVVEVGLFIGLASRVIVGSAEGQIRELLPQNRDLPSSAN